MAVVDDVADRRMLCRDGETLGGDAGADLGGGKVVAGNDAGYADFLGSGDFPDVVNHFVEAALIEDGRFDEKPGSF